LIDKFLGVLGCVVERGSEGGVAASIWLCQHYQPDQKADSHLSSIKVKSHFLLFVPLDGIKYANRPTPTAAKAPKRLNTRKNCLWLCW